MRGQEHTVMVYLVWAVFFLAAFFLVQQIFHTTIVSSTPSPLPLILDTIRSAINAGETGITGEVCVNVTPQGSITITKDMIERQLGFAGNVEFECKSGGCTATESSITLEGRNGRLCAKLENGTLTVMWR